MGTEKRRPVTRRVWWKTLDAALDYVLSGRRKGQASRSIYLLMIAEAIKLLIFVSKSFKSYSLRKQYTEMTRIVLEVQQDKDLDLLLALLQRLNIRVVQKSSEETQSDSAMKTGYSF